MWTSGGNVLCSIAKAFGLARLYTATRHSHRLHPHTPFIHLHVFLFVDGSSPLDSYLFSVRDLVKVEQEWMKPEMAEFRQIAVNGPDSSGLE